MLAISKQSEFEIGPSSRIWVGTFLLFVLLAASGAIAQSKIKVSGEVSDPSGAVVSGASIHVAVKECKCEDCPNPTTCDCCPNQFTLNTDSAGRFEFSVPHGIYDVDVKASAGTAHLEVDLNSGDQKTVSIHLTQSSVSAAGNSSR
jgi:carboxypeptidase family protein